MFHHLQIIYFECCIQTKVHLKHCGNNFFLMMYQGSLVKTNQKDQMPIRGKIINLMSRIFAEVGKQHNLHNDFTNRGYIQFQRKVWLRRPRDSQIHCSKPNEGNTYVGYNYSILIITCINRLEDHVI
jgi:hypothetical protein